MDIPRFESFFNYAKVLAYLTALIPFRLPNDTRKFDFLINFFGIIFTLNQLLITVCFLMHIFTIQKDAAIGIISHIPFVFYGSEGWVRYFFLILRRKEMNSVIDELQELYDLPWDYNKKSVQTLNLHRKRMNKMLVFAAFCSLIFSVGPIILTTLLYWIWNIWSVQYILDTWRPFDKDKYYWLTYIIDWTVSKYATSTTFVVDGIQIMMLIQMNYHFECMGNGIVKTIQNHSVSKNSTERCNIADKEKKHEIQSLNGLIKIHYKVLK